MAVKVLELRGSRVPRIPRLPLGRTFNCNLQCNCNTWCATYRKKFVSTSLDPPTTFFSRPSISDILSWTWPFFLLCFIALSTLAKMIHSFTRSTKQLAMQNSHLRCCVYVERALLPTLGDKCKWNVHRPRVFIAFLCCVRWRCWKKSAFRNINWMVNMTGGGGNLLFSSSSL